MDIPGDKIERPYGAWMKAEPRRRSYTMGSKWLRPGGVLPVGELSAGREDQVVSEINVEERNHGEIVGRKEFVSSQTGEIIMGGIGGEVSGKDKVVQNVSTEIQNSKFQIEGKYVDLENKGLMVTDPKRRRLGHDIGPDGLAEENADIEMETQENATTNQKNFFLAGSALQARHSS